MAGDATHLGILREDVVHQPFVPGRRAPQQPHTPGTATRMPCELEPPGRPGWRRLLRNQIQTGNRRVPLLEHQGPPVLPAVSLPLPTLRHCFSCLVSFAWGSGIGASQIRISSGSGPLNTHMLRASACACTCKHTHTHSGPRLYKTASCSPRLFPGPRRSSNWEGGYSTYPTL